MLILSRKVDQEIVIPEAGISIKVLRIKGGTVQIGISAPQSLPVYRRELWEQWNGDKADDA